MRLLIASVAIAMIAAPASLFAQVAPSVSTPAQSHQDACGRMALAVVPETELDGRVEQMLGALLDGLYKQDENLKNLESKFPGMRVAMESDMRPAISKHATSAMPQYRADLAGLYCANLTTAEALRAGAFFRSAAMRKFTAGLESNLRYSAMSKDINSDRDISVASVRKDYAGAANSAAAGLTLAERVQIQAFFVSPLGRKVTALNPQKLAIDTKWANYSTPAAESEIEGIVLDSMVAHIRKTDPELADEMRKELDLPLKPD